MIAAWCNYVLVNVDLDLTLEPLDTIFRGERLGRVRRNCATPRPGEDSKKTLKELQTQVKKWGE
jgi:hypothetical protein